MSRTDQDEASSFRYRCSSIVRFGEIDIRHHMNNVAILRLMETARVEYLLEVGIGHPMSYDCAVVSLEVDFSAAAQYRDELLCGVRTRAVRNTSFTLAERLWRPDDEVVIATGNVTLVHRSGDPSRPTRVPDGWRECFARFERAPVPGTETSIS